MKEIFPQIVVDPNVQFGKPIIAGTRVPVGVIIGHIAAGDSLEDVAEEYGIKIENVQAALKYASKIISDETIIYNSEFSN
jgi:uncharacterized protein (DUF433 family)